MYHGRVEVGALVERRHDNQWLTAALERPFGRGMNLQIDVAAVLPVIQRLDAAAYPLFKASKDVWYRAGEVEVGQRHRVG